MKYHKYKLNAGEVDVIQRLIVKEGYLPHTEQLGHLEYMSQYTIDDVEYLFHKKTLMDVEVYRLESMDCSYVCDCNRLWNFGKICKYPEKYRNGGCS